jgi:hypothetical protein
MAEENWFEVCSAGEGTMQEALKDQTFHYVKGVPEARDGQPLQHDPPPRFSGHDAGANFDGAVALCEAGRAMLEHEAPFPATDPSIKDDLDVNTAWNIFAKELGADNEQRWGCVTDAIMVGYTVREAEIRAGRAQQWRALEVLHEHPIWVSVDMDARTREVEIPQNFAYGAVGWGAAQRWSYAYVSDRYRKATGDLLELDLVTATDYGYGFRRAVQQLEAQAAEHP